MNDGDVPNFKTLQAFIRISDVWVWFRKGNDDAASCVTNDKVTNGDRTSLEDFAKEVDLKASNLSEIAEWRP